MTQRTDPSPLLSPPDVNANLSSVQIRLTRSLREAGRESNATRIIAVSKKHDVDRIEPLLAAGHRVFGENRVQEAQSKWPALRERYPGVELHLVGPLQSNKVADAVALFDVIQTVDRPKIARALADQITRLGKTPRLLIQINTGAESQKAGVKPEDTDDFLAYCRDACGLAIDGLMCIPPIDQPPAPYFALLGKIANNHHLRLLSMGMSADFEIAAQFGATHVRVGTEIFGARPQ